MNYFDLPFLKLSSLRETDRILREAAGPVQLSGCVESQKAHIISRAGSGATRLVVTYDEREARSLSEDLRMFSPAVLYFPPKDLLFYQADIRSNTIAAERMKVLRALTEEDSRPVTVVTTIAGMMNTMTPPGEFREGLLKLSEGAVCETEAVVRRLCSLGYERTARVENPGEFAVHGGILDVFDLTSEYPVRVEFWDDEIDTIRRFDGETQLSSDRIPEVTVYPVTELVLSRETLSAGRKLMEKDFRSNLEALKDRNDLSSAASLQQLCQDAEEDLSAEVLRGSLERFLPYFYKHPASLSDYLPENAVLVLEEPARMEEYGKGTELEFSESFRNRLEKGLALPGQAGIMRPLKETFASLERGRTLALTGLDTRLTVLNVRNTFGIECQSSVSYAGNFQGLLSDLGKYLHQKYSVILLSPSRTRGSRMAEELRENGLKAYFSEEEEGEVEAGTLLVTRGSLHRGFVYPQLKFVVLTEGDIYGGEKKKKRPKYTEKDTKRILNFSELSVNDYVVHENYGIGIYQGIVNLTADETARDYMKISYGDSGTLYIPVTNLDVVQKYASADARPPRLNRLDSPDWKRTRGRVKAAVEEVAEELVNLYALRENSRGHAYAKDTIWQKEFEELFPFEETGDQLTAIEAVKNDMESGKIMDRLLCGDVGFGKTEVALRAAFKAVMDGKQVAYLVPTTILAKQHYNTFTERLQNSGVQVDMLSRFRTPKEQEATVAELRKGSVDILIGTHRILSKDVVFKDLGLLIIDEEQRFGVTHKEKIKQLRTNVDVLTMTATPIPRTLHMSMIGVRDMSVLEEPPTDRLAIQTYVCEYSEELVREAIRRELSRDGQVYYVYNRAADIDSVAAKIQTLCPDASVAYAHGKMSERELERVMLRFVEGEIDVLVSTTIIETGLDIPNVNTIIVHDAERYGLAQLYQLRGRVGRSSRQAYAFIMYRKNRVPNEEAEKRLEAIRQFTELGSGVKIAMQDLEIRGAGAVLGNAQSGHMTLVGYDLYCKMLAEAVRKTRDGEEAEEEFETLLDLRVDAYIPDNYTGSESVKLELYKKISLLTGEEDAELLLEELCDRFGEPPKEVKNLVTVALLRSLARSLYLSEIKGNDMELKFTFVPFAKVKGENIPALIRQMGGSMRYLQAAQPALLWQQRNLLLAGKRPVLDIVKELLNQIKELLI